MTASPGLVRPTRRLVHRRAREASVPLSPFSARLALAAFLTIAACIGSNLLLFQSSEDRGLADRLTFLRPRPRPLTDAEKLERLAMRAVGSGEASDAEPLSRGAGVSAERDTAVRTQRIGSFAPSAGKLALSALPGADPGEVKRATIRSVQLELAKRGYEPGPADGAPGLVTRAAVMAYEHDQGLPLTADPSPEVLAHLRHGTSAPGAAIGLDATAPRSNGSAEQVIRAVQQSLAQLGYLASPPDGFASDETLRAIREFEMDSGLVPSGRISGPLVARLTRQLAGTGSR
jgi:peptidoglycan hydrolase-like protein with peptidoglycan-binding domain